MLSLAFFLPTIDGCHQPASPFKELHNFAKDKDYMSHFDSDHAFVEGGCLFPYLHGFLIACSVLIAWRSKVGIVKKLFLFAALAAAIGAITTGHMLFEVFKADDENNIRTWIIHALPALWLAIGLGILAIFKMRDARLSLLWISILGSIPTAGWFIFWLLDNPKNLLIGWYIGFFGNILMLSGAIWGLFARKEILKHFWDRSTPGVESDNTG